MTPAEILVCVDAGVWREDREREHAAVLTSALLAAWGAKVKPTDLLDPAHVARAMRRAAGEAAGV